MTEQEWLALDDPLPMLEFAAGRTSDRKLRLFLCACCARVLESSARWGQITSAGRQMGSVRRIWGALETVEQFADGLCGTKGLASARRAAQEAVDVPASIDYGGETGLDGEADTVRGAAARRLTPESVLGAFRQALATLRYHHLLRGRTLHGAGASLDPLAEHQRDMARWLRDVVGNPFRPTEGDPVWQTPTVLSLAQAAYDARPLPSGTLDPARLAILGDALEDAGCADEEILTHCRTPGHHVRGCWVLDLFIEAPHRFALAAASPEPEEETPPAAVQPPPAEPRPPSRPGDWFCPGCQAHNFAQRNACLRCQHARPAPRLREGDWFCPGCDAHNFARRQSCHQCKGARLS